MAQPTILVAEDEAPVRAILSLALREAGFAVIEAKDGREALTIQREKRCDIIVTDIFMPSQDGLEVVQQLRGLSPMVKIVAISGGGNLGRLALDFDALDVARKLGADAVLQKPFSLETLLSTIRTLAT